VFRVRRVPAWRSATDPVAGPTSYSAFGYANVLRHVLGNVLGTRRESVTLPAGPSPGVPGPAGPRLAVRTTVVEPVVAYLYRPARAGFLRLVAVVRALQSGRLDAYVGYMLVALIVLLAVVAALG
jgi:hypothetical protein